MKLDKPIVVQNTVSGKFGVAVKKLEKDYALYTNYSHGWKYVRWKIENVVETPEFEPEDIGYKTGEIVRKIWGYLKNISTGTYGIASNKPVTIGGKKYVFVHRKNMGNTKWLLDNTMRVSRDEYIAVMEKTGHSRVGKVYQGEVDKSKWRVCRVDRGGCGKKINPDPLVDGGWWLCRECHGRNVDSTPQYYDETIDGAVDHQPGLRGY